MKFALFLQPPFGLPVRREVFLMTGQLVPTKASEDQRSVVQESHFDPWGLNLADMETTPGSSTDWWQFAGQERDFGAYTEFALRQYDASLGRFTSVDPMADAFVGISPFNYADNSPIANIDLYGLQAVPISAAAQSEANALGIFLNGGAVMYNVAPSIAQTVGRFVGEFAGAIGNNLAGLASAVMHPIETSKQLGVSSFETMLDWSYRVPNAPGCLGCVNPNYNTAEGAVRRQRALRDVDQAIADVKAHPGRAAGNTAFFLFGPKVLGKLGGKALNLASRLEVAPNTLGANFGNLRIRGNAEAIAAQGERGLWDLTEEGASQIKKHTVWGNMYRSHSDGLWWSRDKLGHGGSKFKVFKQTNKGLEWFKDADEFGDFIINKHKGETGKFIPWGQLSTVK